MKYMMLIHHGPGIGEYPNLPDEEKKAIYAAWKAINETPGVSPGLQLRAPRDGDDRAGARTARR